MAKILLGNIKGPKGDNGDSAYAVAVNNGFNGTEAEWLESLKGPKGDPGDNELTEDEKQEIIDSLVNESGNMFDIVSSANGSSLHITDSAEANLIGYKMYGKSVQDGTPTPEAPIEIESVGDSGSVETTFTNADTTLSQTYIFPLTEPLRGVGDIRDEIDFARGILTRRFVEIDLGTLTWSKNGSNTQFYATLPYNTKTGYATNHLCSAYIASEKGAYTDRTNHTITLSATRAWVWDSDYTNSADFTNSVQGVKLIYELAEPIETPLTDEEIAQFRSMHTYESVTNISTNDIGDISAEYVRNTKLGKDVVTVVDSKIESNGIVLYKVNPSEKAGIYCNGNTTIDGVNSVLLKDSTKKIKRLKIFARFPYATAIQEFDLTTTSLGDNATYGNRTGGIFVPTADNTEGANSHWFSKLNFAVYESDDGWTFHVIDSGWLGMGIPSVSASDYADGTTTRVNGTEYPHWNQRHNSDYAIYKIVGYMNK